MVLGLPGQGHSWRPEVNQALSMSHSILESPPPPVQDLSHPAGWAGASSSQLPGASCRHLSPALRPVTSRGQLATSPGSGRGSHCRDRQMPFLPLPPWPQSCQHLTRAEPAQEVRFQQDSVSLAGTGFSWAITGPTSSWSIGGGEGGRPQERGGPRSVEWILVNSKGG